jgi:hypothetical protein
MLVKSSIPLSAADVNGHSEKNMTEYTGKKREVVRTSDLQKCVDKCWNGIYTDS